MKDEMANLVSSARAVSRVISAGEEYRPVVVRQYADYEDGTVKFVRLDTNEVMSVRTMTEDERQVPLSLALDAPAPEPAA
jgi:hypothetical protein